MHSTISAFVVALFALISSIGVGMLVYYAAVGTDDDEEPACWLTFFFWCFCAAGLIVGLCVHYGHPFASATAMILIVFGSQITMSVLLASFRYLAPLARRTVESATRPKSGNSA